MPPVVPLQPVHDQDGEEAGIVVGRGVFVDSQLARVGAALLILAAPVRDAAAAAPPEACPVGAMDAAEREAAGVEGEPGVATAAVESVAREDGGGAGGTVAAFTAVGRFAVPAHHVAVVGWGVGQVHEHGLRVAGDQLPVGADVPLQLGAVLRGVSGHAVPVQGLLRRHGCCVLQAQQLLHMVVNISSPILYEYPERPGDHQDSCHPERIVGHVPREVIRVPVGHHKLFKVYVFELHAFPHLHVVIQPLNLCEEVSPLSQVRVLRLNVGKAEALGEPQLGGCMALQAQELLGDVLVSTVRVVKLSFSHVGVDPLVVDLCGGVGIAIAVPGHLPGSPHKVVADGFPPDARSGLLHAVDAFIDTVHICLVLQLSLHVAVPALHQVHHVQHREEGQRDIDIAVRAWAVMIDHGLALEGAVKTELGDPGQLTPGHCTQAAIHEDGEEEAFPVGLPAHAGTQGLLHGALLQSQHQGGGEKDKERARNLSVTPLCTMYTVTAAFKTASGFALHCLRTGTPPYLI